jgi:hypothetical protein
MSIFGEDNGRTMWRELGDDVTEKLTVYHRRHLIFCPHNGVYTLAAPHRLVNTVRHYP